MRYLALVLVVGISQARGEEARFEEKEGATLVLWGTRPIARFVHADPTIPRPYLCDLFTTTGERVTRNHPPIEGKDLTDHETMHPGVWLSFSDLNGADFWRNKEVTRAVGKPIAHGTTLRSGFEYVARGEVLARETRTMRFQSTPAGYWILWDSEITGAKELVFGDQEEMGFGARMAMAITVKEKGRMENSEGAINEKGVWGKIAHWLDYGMEEDGMRVGMMMIPDERNVRPSYFHARDYGMMTANMFGERAFTGKGDGTFRLAAGETLRLRYGLFVYGARTNEVGSGEARAAEYAKLAE